MSNWKLKILFSIKIFFHLSMLFFGILFILSGIYSLINKEKEVRYSIFIIILGFLLITGMTGLLTYSHRKKKKDLARKNWKCPVCNSVYIKKETNLGLSKRGVIISGYITCSKCGSEFNNNDVYQGKYDG